MNAEIGLVNSARGLPESENNLEVCANKLSVWPQAESLLCCLRQVSAPLPGQSRYRRHIWTHLGPV